VRVARASDLAHSLRNVLWIGGSVCAGKSTAAARLAEGYGLRAYHYDRHEPLHIQRCSPEQQPHLSAFLAMTMDERWVLRSPRTMAQHTLTCWADERFPMVLDDLLELGDGRPIVAEGVGLLPANVAPLMSDARAAVWLVATPECIRYVRQVRGEGISLSTTNPTRAFENLVARDILMTEHIRTQAEVLGFPIINITIRDLAETHSIVERHFATRLRLPPLLD